MENTLGKILDSVTPDEVVGGRRVIRPRAGMVLTGTIDAVKLSKEPGKDSVIEATLDKGEEKVILSGVFGGFHSPGAKFQARAVYSAELGSDWSVVSTRGEEVTLPASKFAKDYEARIKQQEEQRQVLKDGLTAFGANFKLDYLYGVKIELPEQLKREKAIELAQNEIGGKRFTELKKELREFDEQDLSHERKINQLKKDLNKLPARDRLAGKTLLIRREINRETKAATKTRETLREITEQYNILVDALRTPEKKAEIAKRVDELMLQSQHEYDKALKVKSAYRFTAISILDARESKAEFELLGDEQVKTIGTERAIPADRKSFNQSIQKARELGQALSNELNR